MDVTIECVCPPKGEQTRHPDGDRVTLRDRLDFRGAVTIRQGIGVLRAEDPESSVADILGLLIEHYLLFGIESWTLADAKGKAVPVLRPAIREFMEGHQTEALLVGDAADALYAEQVLVPLLRRAVNASQPTPASDTTSPTSGSTSRTRRSPSSITSIPTAATGKTSSRRGGAGSTSQSSASVA